MPPTTPNPRAERDELILFFDAMSLDDRRTLFVDHFRSRTIPATLYYLDPDLPCFVPNQQVRKLIVAGAKTYTTNYLAEQHAAWEKNA